MNQSIGRELGEQPIAEIMTADNLKPRNLVAASKEQLTHKMVAKARKGRRLTPNVKAKILRAINHATGKTYSIRDLFNY